MISVMLLRVVCNIALPCYSGVIAGCECFMLTTYNLQLSVLHKTAELRFGDTGLKLKSHVCKMSPKAQQNTNRTSVSYSSLLSGLRKHPHLAHREKNTQLATASKQKRLEAKTAHRSEFLQNKQRIAKGGAQTLFETRNSY